MSNRKATLTFNDTGKSIDLEILSGTEGPDTIDITSLYGQAKVFTYDPGFVSTASCNSSITYIDGNEGVLRYRGYPIEQLAAKSTFIEVAYLLLYGDLPSREQLAQFQDIITHHTMIINNEDFSRFGHKAPFPLIPEE